MSTCSSCGATITWLVTNTGKSMPVDGTITAAPGRLPVFVRRLIEGKNTVAMGQPKDMICCDCAGFDVEWMYRCDKHGTYRCRGCHCVYCIEDEMDQYEEDGPMNLEDQLDRALDAAFPPITSAEPK